ncbi:MAG: hypothetical protein AB7T49_14415 [Oligoflexales bacterium]
MIRYLILCFFIGGCFHKRASVNLSDFGIYTSDKVGNKTFKDVGPVFGSKTEFIFSGDCQEVVTLAIEDMLSRAKERGANTVYNVRFLHKNHELETPVCKYNLVIALKSVRVRGMAAIIEPEKTSLTSIYIPKDANLHEVAANWYRKNWAM